MAPKCERCVCVRQHERLPCNGYISSNFWVDVVFNTSFGGFPPPVSTTSLPNATQSAAYNQSLAAVGALPRIVGQSFQDFAVRFDSVHWRTDLRYADYFWGPATSHCAGDRFGCARADRTQALSITVVGPTGNQKQRGAEWQLCI